jgi:hypothetical protein
MTRQLPLPLLAVTFLFTVSCSSSSPKTGSPSSLVKAASDSTVGQSSPQQWAEIPPESVLAQEVRIVNDVKTVTVANAQGRYFLSCNRTLDSCMTPTPGRDYLLFSKATRWGPTGKTTLAFLQDYTVTYNNEENIGLVPSDGDKGTAPDGSWHPEIGMYWLVSWSRNK